ncbi:hypothetical protein QBZ16_003812 [Prototheca wickerhamii]|uniref:Gamma-tubulin complex component n=1 Tax=Prototheca wickerhamii TaxID=3111 RepID=A0AAD9IGB8_PROWI|nr:hypothetical protein QBZ16_003812 [Prototheca wickerhamii]
MSRPSWCGPPWPPGPIHDLDMVIPEQILVREVLHACQGISGRYVWWHAGQDGGAFALGSGAEVPPAQRQEVSRIAEVGALLRRVEELRGQAPTPLHEALAAAAAREVSSLNRLLAILEQREGAKAQSLTLRRLEVWLAEPRARLRVLANALEAAAGRRGGPALDALYALSRHGDPLVRAVMTPLLQAAAVPMLRHVAAWLLEGSLDGADADFFIAASPAVAAADASGAGAGGGVHPAVRWRSGHAVVPSLTPRFLPEPLARSLLDAGRTVNFLKHVCGVSVPDAEVAGAAAALADAARNSCTRLDWLAEAAAEVGRAASRRLLRVLLEEQGLESHLTALKQYVLLGRADVACALQDGAEAELDLPARQVSQFVLQGHLDAALRASATAAGEASGALDRLSVRLRARSTATPAGTCLACTTRWTGPLSAVLSPGALASLLWGIKRAERTLSRAWARLSDAAHALARLRELERQHGAQVPGAELVPAMLRAFHAWRSEAAQFAASLQSYVSLEVIEALWTDFLRKVPKAADLDELVRLHEDTLARVTEKLFIDGPPAREAGGPAPPASAREVHAGLLTTLRSVTGLLAPADALARLVERACEEQRGYLARVRESEQRGAWTDEVYRSPEIERAGLTDLHGAMWQAHAAYERHLHTFLAQLPAQSHQDLRFFLSRLEDAGAAGEGGVGAATPREDVAATLQF